MRISSFSAEAPPDWHSVAPGEQVLQQTSRYQHLCETRVLPKPAAKLPLIVGSMLTKNPALTRVQVRDILTSTARNLGAANTFGAGLLQAGAALREAANPAAPPPAKTAIYVYAEFL